MELLEVEEGDEAVARACLGASIARVLYHAAVVGAGLRGEGEERSGQEEEHLAPRSGCRVDVCDHCDCYMNHNVLPSSRQQVTVHW